MATATSNRSNCMSNIAIKIVSFNMHGFNQGCSAVDDMINLYSPDVFLLQQHWLTPANLYKFYHHFADYFSFGSSAMSCAIEAGMLRGRPHGGMITLVNNRLRKLAKVIHCSDRYVIIQVGDCLIVNVYLPCVGSANRQLICDEILTEIGVWCQRFDKCKIIIAGDYNVNLDSSDAIARNIASFAQNQSLSRCDDLFPSQKAPTYVNIPLNQQSCIDYILASPSSAVTEFFIIDPDINFSDHLPLFAAVTCCVPLTGDKDVCNSNNRDNFQRQLRWDQADLGSFYYHTGDQLSPLLTKADHILERVNSCNISGSDMFNYIDDLYTSIAEVLVSCAKLFVPERRKGFYKFWWDQDLAPTKGSFFRGKSDLESGR